MAVVRLVSVEVSKPSYATNTNVVTTVTTITTTINTIILFTMITIIQFLILIINHNTSKQLIAY